VLVPQAMVRHSQSFQNTTSSRDRRRPNTSASASCYYTSDRLGRYRTFSPSACIDLGRRLAQNTAVCHAARACSERMFHAVLSQCPRVNEPCATRVDRQTTDDSNPSQRHSWREIHVLQSMHLFSGMRVHIASASTGTPEQHEDVTQAQVQYQRATNTTSVCSADGTAPSAVLARTLCRLLPCTDLQCRLPCNPAVPTPPLDTPTSASLCKSWVRTPRQRCLKMLRAVNVQHSEMCSISTTPTSSGSVTTSFGMAAAADCVREIDGANRSWQTAADCITTRLLQAGFVTRISPSYREFSAGVPSAACLSIGYIDARRKRGNEAKSESQKAV
jgi:hypothetical protein